MHSARPAGMTPPGMPRDKGGSLTPLPAHAPTTHTPSRPSAEPNNGKNVFEAR
jgi:hypothetical protein